MDRLFVTVSHLNACCVNKHSSLVRCLIALPILLLLLTATTRPVPHQKISLQPIAFDQRLPYKDPHLAVSRRVEDLLSRMTVEEKIRQLDMYWGKEVADMDGANADGRMRSWSCAAQEARTEEGWWRARAGH